ncbi:MAG: hypothetical protein ACOVO5_03480 [Devosia sp.]|jgi:hypothetical protein|uniref:hypothetical protein n=1 Tax=Devosia sp. TaxID=1871048 RepID=UPI0037BFF0B4
MSRITQEVVSQDNRNDGDGEQVLINQPMSQSEIDELLYSDVFSRDERLARLREIREELSDQEASDFGSDDPGALLGQVIEAIAALEGDLGESMDPASVDHNPEDHRETLSPDSDELEAIEAADEASLEERPL